MNDTHHNQDDQDDTHEAHDDAAADIDDNGGIEENKFLGDVIGDAWAGRVYLFLGAVIGLVCAVIFLSILTPRHTATMVIAPAERAGGTDIRALFPENSEFAIKYLKGSIADGPSTDFMRFKQMLLGPTVAKKLMEEPDLHVVQGVKNSKRMLFFGGPTVRTPEQLSAYLKSNVKIEPVPDSPMIKMVFLHPDSQFAVNLLKSIYHATDDIIKADIKEQAVRRHTFFSKAMITETNPEDKKNIVALLREQDNIIRMLALDEPFAATIVEPASTGVDPDWPSYPLVIAVFMFAGMFWNYARFHQRYKHRPKSLRKRNFDE